MQLKPSSARGDIYLLVTVTGAHTAQLRGEQLLTAKIEFTVTDKT